MFCPINSGESRRGVFEIFFSLIFGEHKAIIFLNKNKQQSLSRYSCVIYCHGNCGNRTAVFEVLELLLLMNYVVICFDFSGCGLSEGEYVSMGIFEKEDLREVVNYASKLDFIEG